jgi:ATP adenylyltransferase
MKRPCILCEEITGPRPLSGRVFGIRSKPIVESPNFVVVPDIRPIVAGHSLLITKDHFVSFAALPDCYRDEFNLIRDRAVSKLAGRHRTAPFVFEHGPAAHGFHSGGCVSHAHLHLIPVQAPVLTLLEESIDGQIRRGAGEIFSTLSSVRSSYLYYGSRDGDDYIVDEFKSPVPCQFIRRALAAHLGIHDWNWKNVLGASEARP